MTERELYQHESEIKRLEDVMTVGDARKLREPCPGRDRCQKIGDLFDHEHLGDIALQDAIVKTCKDCGKEAKA